MRTVSFYFIYHIHTEWTPCLQDGRSFITEWTPCLQDGRSFFTEWTPCLQDGRSFITEWTPCLQDGRSFITEWTPCMQDGRSFFTEGITRIPVNPSVMQKVNTRILVLTFYRNYDIIIIPLSACSHRSSCSCTGDGRQSCRDGRS